MLPAVFRAEYCLAVVHNATKQGKAVRLTVAVKLNGHFVIGVLVVTIAPHLLYGQTSRDWLWGLYCAFGIDEFHFYSIGIRRVHHPLHAVFPVYRSAVVTVVT